MSTRRELLRHVIATIAYRGGKALRNAPAGFSEVRLENGSRSAGEILAHVCDLFAWAVQMCRGEHVWSERRSATWDEEVNRFHQSLAELDEVLQSTQPLGFTEEKIFQGPLADALEHIGQIALLRRIAGSPVRGENYFRAEIVAGRVGPDQAAPVREFD